MVAPIDAVTVIDIDGEAITLRLNFQTIAMGEQLGVDLFSGQGIEFTLARSALLVKALSCADHPGMSEDEALAIVVRHGGDRIAAVVLDLCDRFGGKADEPKKDTEGNVPKAAGRNRKAKPAG